MQHILILAGGSGTRLWPLSHQGEPKQLLELIDGVSLLRMAYERVAGLVPDANILVCTGSSYADTVAKLLPEVPAENILGEPVGRESLNAVAWPAGIIADRDPDGVMAVVTADHIIRPVDDFRAALQHGFDLVNTDPTASDFRCCPHRAQYRIRIPASRWPAKAWFACSPGTGIR